MKIAIDNKRNPFILKTMKGYLVKLYPNKAQQEQINNNLGSVRFVCNKMIEINSKKYHRTGKGLSGYDMASYLPKLKKQYTFLKEVNSQSLQIACYNLAEAYSKFFKKQGGYPSFKKKNSKQSFCCITGASLLNKQIKLPKLGLIKYRGGDRAKGNIKRFTISNDSTGYYVSMLIDDKKEIKQQAIKNILGVDVGIKDFAICSDGKVIANQKFYTRTQKKLKKLQQALSRKQKGSKKRQQAKTLLGRLHKKIYNQRKDYAHKTSRQLVGGCDNQTALSIESLNVLGMMKNPNLAKQIADCGWSQFLTFLKYKAVDVGKQVIEIGRFYPSSKTCSLCGFVNQNLTLNDRKWTCPDCKTTHDRDINASINIAMEGARIKADSKPAGGVVFNLDEVLQNIKLSNHNEADKYLNGACTVC